MAENKNIDNNKLASESHNRKKENYNNFFNSFDDEYKLIKKLTHQCQTKCYGTEKFSAKEAENCARICLKPFLNLRHLNNEKIQNCEKNFQYNESKCLNSSSNSSNLQDCYNTIVLQHNNCLKTLIQPIKNTYKEYISDFDQLSSNEM